MLNLKQSKNSHRASKNKGFTLVELLITITIFVIITGVVLVNSKSFDNSVLLNNFAYDVALTIKQAQSYGVNNRENTNILDAANLFSYAYGVYFDVGDSKGSRTNFVLYTDTGGGINGTPNQKYDGDLKICPTDSPECIQKYTIRKGTSIQSICAGTDETDCNNNIGTTKQLSILFQRPSLRAKIYINGEADNGTNNKSYAKIILAADNGATQQVVVTASGQIYVKK